MALSLVSSYGPLSWLKLMDGWGLGIWRGWSSWLGSISPLTPSWLQPSFPGPQTLSSSLCLYLQNGASPECGWEGDIGPSLKFTSHLLLLWAPCSDIGTGLSSVLRAIVHHTLRHFHRKCNFLCLSLKSLHYQNSPHFSKNEQSDVLI